MGTIVDGIVLVSSSWAHFLFDTSTSHSYIYALFVSILGLEFETLDFVMNVGVPLDEIVNYFMVVVLYVSRMVETILGQINGYAHGAV